MSVEGGRNMKYTEFSKEEKIAFFDEIASHFYEANFGQMSKADLELLMFRFYLEKMISTYQNEDGTIDYNKCSDYKISKELGITQQKVRNLKVKKELVYPTKYDWKAALARITENARYDKETGKVTLNIPDPNLSIEIQNFIEEKGAYVEMQLNSKILQIRAEYYIALVIALEQGDNRKKIIAELKKHCKDEKEFDEQNIGKSLLKLAVNVSTIGANLTDMLSSENTIGAALLKLLTK